MTNLAEKLDMLPEARRRRIEALAEELRAERRGVLTNTELDNVATISGLLREWQVMEAEEMARITEGRIAIIGKFQEFIDGDALEVPTLHKFLKDFPWVIDPAWTLVADEAHYSEILRQEFPDADKPEPDRRIDFLCARTGGNLAVVEFKRPGLTASSEALEQIEGYTNFMRAHVAGTTDPELRVGQVNGYLLCGKVAGSVKVRGRRNNLARAGIFVRRYTDLLARVRSLHEDVIERYNQLKESKNKSSQNTERPNP